MALCRLGPAVLLAALLVGAGPCDAAVEPPAPCKGCYLPKPTTKPWQWQLSGAAIDLRPRAVMYDVDALEVPARVVRELHSRSRRAVCYVDVGSWEGFREDAGRFPPETLGNAYEGFPDERWLDIRRIDLLAPVLEARLDICRAKGFDGVEPDNLDGYQNDTGFPLSYGDQIAFNVWIANAAHRRGLSVALKNDGEQVRDLLRYFDFAIVEECFEARECRLYQPFVAAGKAVFVAEYRLAPRRFCPQARRRRMSAIRKRPSLGAFRLTCPRARG